MAMCARKGCTEEGTEFIGKNRRKYCVKHRRWQLIGNSAKRRGKYQPSWEELDALFTEIVDMKCPACGVVMTWRRQKGEGGRVMSLQHDRSGTIRLICFTCNLRYQSWPGDTYYNRAADTKYCAGCKKELSIFAFSANKQSPPHCRDAYCKECRSRKRKEERNRNPEKYQRINAMRRQKRLEAANV